MVVGLGFAVVVLGTMALRGGRPKPEPSPATPVANSSPLDSGSAGSPVPRSTATRTLGTAPSKPDATALPNVAQASRTPTTQTVRNPGIPTPLATYTVVSGDNPSTIANKLGIPEAEQRRWIQELLQLNATTSAGLQVGQILKLPP